VEKEWVRGNRPVVRRNPSEIEFNDFVEFHNSIRMPEERRVVSALLDPPALPASVPVDVGFSSI
jgi:hypothetical protein